ncbi:MAG: hypothetical protein R2796_09065 [Chitinophagaceae bacterium]|nr:hypothetical protein [Chitinophagaceae bacterium]MCB0741374.1 hypothetical protein [Chitinophagaceae bacterium]
MRFLVFFLLFVSLNGFGQWKDYTISVRGDTLNRIDMKGQKQGPWVESVPDLRGERGYDAQGYYVNNLKEGTWKKFSLQGVKIAEENYKWGMLNGKQKYYTYNGGLERIESWRAIDPKNSFDTVAVYDLNDPTKIAKTVIVKNDGVSFKHGKWVYLDPVWGKVESTEYYVMNKLQEDNALADNDDIQPIDISNNKKLDSIRRANNPAILKIKAYEKEHAGKKKFKVRDGSTGY